MALTLPDDYRGFRLADVARSIVEVDQFDDWIVDPVYFADVDPDALATSIASAVATGSVDPAGATAFDVHSLHARKFTAVALPLAFRVVLADVIASQADKLQKALIRNKTFGLEYFPPRAAGAVSPRWTIDLFARGAVAKAAPDPAHTDRPTGGDAPADDDDPISTSQEDREPANAPTAVFGTGEDGTFRALSAVAASFEHTGFKGLAFRWYDVESFGDSIRRAALFKGLRDAGCPASRVAFLESAIAAVAPAMKDGWPSIDDAASFVAASYLKPVDDWLKSKDVLFFRCRDEYFVFSRLDEAKSGGAFDADACEAGFEKELAKLGLKRRANAIRFDLAPTETEAQDGTRELALVDALLSVHWETTENTTRYFFGAWAPGWGDLCRRVARAADGAPQLAALFELLRVANYARRDLCLLVPSKETKSASARARNYVASLDAETELLARMRGRLGAAGVSPWQTHWMLRLLSDVSAPAATENAYCRAVLDARAEHPWFVWTQAALTLFRAGGGAEDRERAASVLKPTGDATADRYLATAAYFAQLRLGLDPAGLDAFAAGASTAALTTLLRRKLKERER